MRVARHEVLSANIANVDTPGYRPRDLDFNSIIWSAIEPGDVSLEERDRRMEQVSASPLISTLPFTRRNSPMIGIARIGLTRDASYPTCHVSFPDKTVGADFDDRRLN